MEGEFSVPPKGLVWGSVKKTSSAGGGGKKKNLGGKVVFIK